MFKNIFSCNFCGQFSNSFILKSFYQILLTSSNTYLLSLYVYCATHHKYDHNTPLPPQYSVAKIDENWRILWHFRSICYATFKSKRGWIMALNLMNWPLFWFLVSANGCETTYLISFYRFFTSTFSIFGCWKNCRKNNT